MKKIVWFLLIILVLTFTIAISTYSKMPQSIASHWDASGNVNGYMSRTTGAFFIPILLAALSALLLLIPRIDPLKKNIKSFDNHYSNFVIVFILFMFLVYVHTVVWNLGYHIDILMVMPLAFFALFSSIATMLGEAKQNWFIGLRTPWTLSSETVWNKTHALGAKLYRYCAYISLLGLFFLPQSLYLIVIPILTVSLYLVLYSYLEFEKEK